jgi:hypothetical protein
MGDSSEALITTSIFNYLNLIKCASGALLGENNRHSNIDINDVASNKSDFENGI